MRGYFTKNTANHKACGSAICRRKGKMSRITVTIPITPKPKLRPKFSRQYDRVHTYTPRKTKKFENQVYEAYMYQSKGFKFDKGIPLTVSITFGMPIPKSASKKRKTDMAAGIIPHTVKPDCDNLVKSILDALNKAAWYDDAQIVEIRCSKSYANMPYVNIAIQDL